MLKTASQNAYAKDCHLNPPRKISISGTELPLIIMNKGHASIAAMLAPNHNLAFAEVMASNHLLYDEKIPRVKRKTYWGASPKLRCTILPLTGNFSLKKKFVKPRIIIAVRIFLSDGNLSINFLLFFLIPAVVISNTA